MFSIVFVCPQRGGCAWFLVPSGVGMSSGMDMSRWLGMFRAGGYVQGIVCPGGRYVYPLPEGTPLMLTSSGHRSGWYAFWKAFFLLMLIYEELPHIDKISSLKEKAQVAV